MATNAALNAILIIISANLLFLANGFTLSEHNVVAFQPSSKKNSYTYESKKAFYLTQLRVSSGFSFEDGEQVLVSVQKPLGIILEQGEEGGIIVVAEVDPSGSAARAGVKTGDVLLAVQNASVQDQSLEYVLDFLGQAPRVVNLRFSRAQP